MNGALDYIAVELGIVGNTAVQVRLVSMVVFAFAITKNAGIYRSADRYTRIECNLDISGISGQVLTADMAQLFSSAGNNRIRFTPPSTHTNQQARVQLQTLSMLGSISLFSLVKTKFIHGGYV